MKNSIKLVSGNSNRPLAQAISDYLETPLATCQVRRFADMEMFVEIQENVRGEDVFVIQSTSFPANDNLMELLIIIDALRRSSARRITAVIPYFGYGRQDRKTASRTPISAKLVANLITQAGADRVLTLDLHAGADPGLLRHPDRQSLRVAGDGARHQGALRQRLHGGGVARRRRRGAGARAGQAHRCAARHRRQAPRAGRRERGDEHHRQRRGPHLHPGGRPRQFRRHACATPPTRSCGKAPRRSTPIARTASCRAGRWRASPTRSSRKWSSPTRSSPTDAVRKSTRFRILTIAPLMGEAVARTATKSSVSSLFD